MVRPLWQLLLEDPSDLTCDECFALMEYYAELLARGGVGFLTAVIERLKACANCEPQYREALRCLVANQSETSTGSGSDITESYASKAEEKGRLGDRGKGIVGYRAAETVRPHHLRVTGLDEEGKSIDRVLEAFDAVVVHHEIDHLDGVLFIDRVKGIEDLYWTQMDENGRWVRVPVLA